LKVYTHPQYDILSETIGLKSTLMTALFGPIYLIRVQAWLAAFLTTFIAGPAIMFLASAASSSVGSTLAAIAAYAGASLAWACAMQPLVRRSFLRRGWKEVSA
jgi:hypothetical protein